ncbi:hypothetical protein F2P56_035595 [Juglans regia]|uniref:Uncharacterized protein LOC108998121 n=2 Tax=Juglans regia TaxID=51240 RepID=A0A2I4FEN9_JUGRE|nr:uncharacterized protein LOC108998121 [Juglans regia]KAF5442998.1 hypothetical protein F2P56_035595 [Juglans regia]
MQRQLYWQAPSEETFKVNVDGAIFHEKNNAGVGIIARDNEGEVLLSVSMKEQAIMDPMDIELLTILRGLQLCIPLGLQVLYIESDSLLSVTAVTTSEVSSMLGNIISNIKQLMN